MPNVNLSDARMRDAVVKAESTRQRRTVFYQGPKKLPAYTRKVFIQQEEVVYNPDGSMRERREQRRLEANVDEEIPLTWTGKMIPKAEAIRKFVFATKLQIVHINGLTYDFLYEMGSGPISYRHSG